ncbi:leucine-rich repeat protein [Perkinsela sp. CCAP 1560/4]|nr:leucine-rich repeat protein [Perkinsela sp. CCAP 1560/4]|eukprot:KNH08940.1 leucine-rich repeat protein [Perkinsela sp. CCAP 1560/4]
MRFELLFLDTVDPSIGRVDHDSFPQQALMEMVIEAITNKEAIRGEVEEPNDIEEWKGVQVEDGEVVKISWRQFKLKGLLHLEWLPSSVTEFIVRWNNFTGTLDTASLPTSMRRLDLGLNAFTGSLGLERLPEKMEYLGVFGNKLSGSLKLESLPDTLIHFVAFKNEFTGCVDLTRLPAAMENLHLETRIRGRPYV